MAFFDEPAAAPAAAPAEAEAEAATLELPSGSSVAASRMGAGALQRGGVAIATAAK